MASEFDKLAEAAGEFLLMEPLYLDPDQPTGLWFCDCPENVLSVQLNAVCLRPEADWEDVGKCLDFIRRFKYVVIVCPNESQRESMVRELRPRLPAVALYVVEGTGFRGRPTMRSYIETYGGSDLGALLMSAVELPAYGLVDLAAVPPRDLTKVPRVLAGFPYLDQNTGGFLASEVSIWTGKRGSGKSTILSQILLSALDQGRRVCAYSGELDAGQFREWIDLQAAGPEHVCLRKDPLTGKRLYRVKEPVRQRISGWLEGKFWLFDLNCASVHDEDRILAQFEYANLRYGADVFLVDNIMTVELKDRGELPVDRDTMIYIETLTPGRVNLNCTRHLGVDGSDVRDLTRGEIEGQMQNLKLIEVLRRHVPGFENCRLVRLYPFLGVRESRRFRGVETLTEAMLLEGRIGEDAVGLGSYIIDIHDGGGSGTIVKKVRPYGLPYGMCVSRDVDNLMFSGRCASMDAVALSSCRVMPPLMAMGQGAGVGAALAVRKGVDPGQVDVGEIRAVLRADGVMLEPSPEAREMTFPGA